MKKPTFIFDEVFGIGFYVCYKWSREEMRSFFKTYYKYDTTFSYSTYGCVYELENPDTGETRLFLWIDSGVNELTALMGLSHEAVHLTNRVFSQAGVDLCLKNDEPQAYYVSMIVRKTLEAHRVQSKSKIKTKRRGQGKTKTNRRR